MIFASFDMIRIVNLPERKDRRKRMVRQLQEFGLDGDPRVSFFAAVRPSGVGNFSSVGEHGCFMSHLNILQEAADKNASVLIIEDDCEFVDSISSFELSGGWEVFYGGYHAIQPDDVQKSDIIGSHLMGFSSDAVKHLVPYLRKIAMEVGPPPIDGAYVWYRRAHPTLKTVFAEPPVAFQRPSRTDIGNLAFYDRLPIIRQSTELVRQLRNTLMRR